MNNDSFFVDNYYEQVKNEVEDLIDNIEDRHLCRTLNRLLDLINLTHDNTISSVQELSIPVGVIDFGLDNETKLPERKKEGDCGYDAYALEDVTIEPHSAEKVPLGIGLIIPEPFGVKAETRSGNHLKGLNIGSAWVDRGYRGQINALVQNITDEPITIHKGDRPCAIELELTFNMKLVSLDEYCKIYNVSKEEIMNTERKDNAFGSTRKLNKEEIKNENHRCKSYSN